MLEKLNFLVENNKIDESIDFLKSMAQGPLNKYNNRIILLNSRWNKYRQDQIDQIPSEERINAIKKSILELATQMLDSSETPGIDYNGKELIDSKDSKIQRHSTGWGSSRTWKILIVLAVVLTIIISLVYFFDYEVNTGIKGDNNDNNEVIIGNENQ